MKKQDIHRLVERFLDGETSLKEEQQLYEYFAQDDVPGDLKPYCVMFRDLDCLKTSNEKTDFYAFDEGKDIFTLPNALEKNPQENRWKYCCVAASIVVLFACGVLTYNRLNGNYAIAYVNGEKITDDATVVQMATDAMSEIFDNSGNATNNLSEIFNPDLQQ